MDSGYEPSSVLGLAQTRLAPPAAGSATQMAKGRAALPRLAGEGDAPAVRRPRRIAVAAGGGRQVGDGMRLVGIDADEGVVAAP
jgi:hypothetical protein